MFGFVGGAGFGPLRQRCRTLGSHPARRKISVDRRAYWVPRYGRLGSGNCQGWCHPPKFVVRCSAAAGPHDPGALVALDRGIEEFLVGGGNPVAVAAEVDVEVDRAQTGPVGALGV